MEVQFGKIVFILVQSTDVYFLIDSSVSEYISKKHVYYVRRNEPIFHKCVPETSLCHTGVVYGYNFCDGVLLSMKSALPEHCV